MSKQRPSTFQKEMLRIADDLGYHIIHHACERTPEPCLSHGIRALKDKDDQPHD